MRPTHSSLPCIAGELVLCYGAAVTRDGLPAAKDAAVCPLATRPLTHLHRTKVHAATATHDTQCRAGHLQELYSPLDGLVDVLRRAKDVLVLVDQPVEQHGSV